MPDRVPIDAARLRAAVADERYWNAGHPERGAWQSWVADGYQALYSNDRAGSGGVMHVRAFVRDGHAVAAHVRGAPSRDSAESRDAGSASRAEDRSGAVRQQPVSGLHGLAIARRNLLDGSSVAPVMGRRRRDGIIGRRPDTILEGAAGGGGAYRSPAGRSSVQGAPPPTVSPRSQELVDMIAPGGRPIGTRLRGSISDIRSLSGDQPAAEAMLRRLIEGRGAVNITPRGHPGRMYRLDDGSIIGYRPTSSSVNPAIDVNIPGFLEITKLHSCGGGDDNDRGKDLATARGRSDG
ncbi:hypothetical protein KPL78_24295 [Roseomonas sp. HJA6]|uniref:Uncharacterized protein n=1 Tax=Roseomonas alba TaxID=2846776 RepID=A0ABS7AFB7_9PROT|nr:hypothetical protein [Neoroseomonas alba]MBW6401002.1 hypothetical protein [Neoroseomonas alba]